MKVSPTHNLFSAITNYDPSPRWVPKVTKTEIELLAKLLNYNPNKRITAADALEDDYFKGNFNKERFRLLL